MKVLLFPGQNSRDPAMLVRLLAAWPEGTAVVDEASDVLDRDLWAAYNPRRGEAMFADNRAVQVGVFLCSHLHLQALRRQGIAGDLSLGLSLGEYNHLVHIGALSFADALRLVDARGAAYDRGPVGMTAAVFPIEEEELADLVARARPHGVVEVVNINTPTQHVVSGERAAVEALLALLAEETFAESVVIDERFPLHSSLLAPAAAAFRPHLLRADWRRPDRPYYPNVKPGPLANPTKEDFVDLLTRQVSSPVLWRDAIENVVEQYPSAELIEVGPRGVLSGMLRRWVQNPRCKTDGADGVVVGGLIQEVLGGLLREVASGLLGEVACVT
jgi:[acyl-carrier-protein] S-malonyltransferase